MTIALTVSVGTSITVTLSSTALVTYAVSPSGERVTLILKRVRPPTV
jgi:hypothetical protein